MIWIDSQVPHIIINLRVEPILDFDFFKKSDDPTLLLDFFLELLTSTCILF